MYVGECTSTAAPTYFLPLLPVMKSKANPDIAKIRELEKLPRIEILSEHNFWGLPPKALSMISHGAYELMYRTFESGEVCVSIRNLEGSERDEEGRSIPFLLMFIADGEDVVILDCFVAKYLVGNSRDEIRKELGLLFSYDYIANGIKFDIPNAYKILKDSAPYQNSLNFAHKLDHVDVLLSNDNQQLKIAIKEHNLHPRSIDMSLTSTSLKALQNTGVEVEIDQKDNEETSNKTDVNKTKRLQTHVTDVKEIEHHETTVTEVKGNEKPKITTAEGKNIGQSQSIITENKDKEQQKSAITEGRDFEQSKLDTSDINNVKEQQSDGPDFKNGEKSQSIETIGIKEKTQSPTTDEDKKNSTPIKRTYQNTDSQKPEVSVKGSQIQQKIESENTSNCPMDNRQKKLLLCIGFVIGLIIGIIIGIALCKLFSE